MRPPLTSITWSAHGSQRPGPRRLVVAEAGRAVGLHGEELRALARVARADHPADDVVGALQPEVVGRHRDHDVVAQQGGQRRHVVALEGVDVAGEQRLVLGVDGGVELVDRRASQRGPRPLERAVDRRHAGVEQLGDLGGLPLEHLAEDEHGALPGGQVLQGGDEGQADRLAGGGDVGRVAVDGR